MELKGLDATERDGRQCRGRGDSFDGGGTDFKDIIKDDLQNLSISGNGE